MTSWVTFAAVVITVGAAVRSTWSPCGLSMLASITPLSEQGRGHRYRTTATWFALGGILGGLTLGAFSAVATMGVHALKLTALQTGAAALAASVLALASDVRLAGVQLPGHHRQVNERWLDKFRPWVYGAGFGWQIGTGLGTYITTAAVYLLVVFAALTGAPRVSVALGVLFGMVRGFAVFLGWHITSTESLTRFHARFVAWGPRVRRVTVALELGAAALFGALLSPWLIMIVIGAAAGEATRRAVRTRSTRTVKARRNWDAVSGVR